jgi:EmrB/QacA subfamily drug resistance transporter
MPAFRRNLIFAAVCVATFMSTLDGSIVNITLPVMSAYFAVNISTIQWVVTAYLLTISSILLIWGRLSDIYGTKYLFASGLAIFTAGSLLCGLSGSFAMLVAARIVQAFGASITMALSQGLVTIIFPASSRGKALGIIGASVAIGSLTGPSLGGLLVQLAGWRSIFYINIPFGLAGTILTLALMKDTVRKPAVKKAFDIKGSVLFILFMLLLFIGLLSMQSGDLPPGLVGAMIGAALLLFVLFVLFERRQNHPLLEISLFRQRFFSLSLASAFIAFLAMFSYIFFMPFYLQTVLGISILKAGLAMSAYPLTTGILAPISGWLSDRAPRIPLTVIGLGCTTTALGLLATVGTATPIAFVILLIVLMGIGGAFFQSPNTSAIMGSVARDKLGVAGSINALFRNLGMVSGTTLSVTLFMFATHAGIGNISGSKIEPAVFMQGFSVVMACAAGLSLAGMVLSAFRNRQKPAQTPEAGQGMDQPSVIN